MQSADPINQFESEKHPLIERLSVEANRETAIASAFFFGLTLAECYCLARLWREEGITIRRQDGPDLERIFSNLGVPTAIQPGIDGRDIFILRPGRTLP